MTLPTAVDAIIPLAVLETMRRLDALPSDGLQEYHLELASKRLGMSATVSAQIQRFLALAARGEPVATTEAEQLLRLAGRRADAAVVFDEAGRCAAEHATQRVPRLGRWIWHAVPFARHRVGCRIATRVLRRVFGLSVERDGDRLVLGAADGAAAQAAPGGLACTLYGAAAAALLRRFCGFEDVVPHTTCVGRGDPACTWLAVTRTGE